MEPMANTRSEQDRERDRRLVAMARRMDHLPGEVAADALLAAIRLEDDDRG